MKKSNDMKYNKINWNKHNKTKQNVYTFDILATISNVILWTLTFIEFYLFVGIFKFIYNLETISGAGFTNVC